VSTGRGTSQEALGSDGSVRRNGRVLVVVPAWNEERSVALVVKEIAASVPDADVLVVDDCSTDRTAEVAREAGARVISNVFNLGVGGAMRVGFRYAADRGYRSLVQVDGDGQHDPRDIPQLLAALDRGPGTRGSADTDDCADTDDSTDPEVRIVIGARFAGAGDFEVPRARRWAMRLLAHRLSRVTQARLTDATSGFRAHNRAAIDLFARTYPTDYLADTVESLIIASQAGGWVGQVAVTMRTRHAGSPSQSTLRATVYLLRVTLLLVLHLIRRRARPAEAKEAT
jgi:glycosyltransferase involved in cell wall biosynthesis